MAIQGFRPIDYTGIGGDVDLGQKFTQGLQIGQAVRGIREKRDDREAAEQAKFQYGVDIQTTFKNPTPRAMAKLMAKYPKQREAFQQGWDLLDEDRKQSEIQETGKVYSALMSGNIDIAKDMLEQRITAVGNTGKDTSKLKNILDYIDVDPKGAAGYAGLMLASVMGTEDFAKTFETLGKEQRAVELQPGEVKKQQAELVKTGVDIGLKESQTKKVLKEISNLGLAAQKTVLELEQLKNEDPTLLTDPKVIFEKEESLRKEYTKNTQDFTDTKDAFRKIAAAADDEVGDISLIFSFMKMLDPTSVVREGEFATAQNATGVPERIRNSFNKAMSGERLGQKQRTKFKTQAKALMKASEKREIEVRRLLGKVIKNYKLNPENVFLIEEGEVVETPLGTPTAITTPAGVQAVPADQTELNPAKVTLSNKSYFKYRKN